MTQIKSIVGLIGQNCGTIGSALTGKEGILMAKFPDGMVAFFHPDHKNLTVDYEMKELVLCKNCKYHAPDMVCNHESEWGNENSRNHCDPEFYCADGERSESG